MDSDIGRRIVEIDLELARLTGQIAAAADPAERVALINLQTEQMREKVQWIQRLPVPVQSQAPPPPPPAASAPAVGAPLPLSEFLSRLIPDWASKNLSCMLLCSEPDDFGGPWRQAWMTWGWGGNVPPVASPGVGAIYLEMPTDASSPMRPGSSNDFVPGPSNVHRRKG